MNPRQVNQALRPLVDEAALRASRANGLIVVLEVIADLLGNHVEALATAAGAAAEVSFSAPAITPVAGSSASVAANRVAASAWVTTVPQSVEMTYQLFRDATAIGPVIRTTSDAVNSIAFASIDWIDNPGDLAAHTYSLHMTASSGTAALGANDGAIVVNQQN
jgi:hypothetical protein